MGGRLLHWLSAYPKRIVIIALFLAFSPPLKNAHYRVSKTSFRYKVVSNPSGAGTPCSIREVLLHPPPSKDEGR
mgnify:FL=1